MPILYLEYPIHINYFSYRDFNVQDEANKDVLESLTLSLDKSILAVEQDKVVSYFNDPEIRAIRYGRKKAPTTVEIKNADDFYRCLAMLIPLEEYC